MPSFGYISFCGLVWNNPNKSPQRRYCNRDCCYCSQCSCGADFFLASKQVHKIIIDQKFREGFCPPVFLSNKLDFV